MSSIPSDQALLQAFARQKSGKVLVSGETSQASSVGSSTGVPNSPHNSANSDATNQIDSSKPSIDGTVSSPRPSIVPIVTDRT
ncbi:hypothetical protein EON65_58750, partial [archaeon]